MKILQAAILISILLASYSCSSDNSSQPKPPKSSPKEINAPTSTQSISTKDSNRNEESSKSTLLSATVDLQSINYTLLDYRLLQKINQERKRLNLPIYTTRPDLNKAATIHNKYMIKANILSHDESGTSTPKMKDRIKKAGGKYRTYGENVQFEGFTIRTYNNVESILAPSYEDLSEELWQNWRTSPGHYKNIINPAFKFLGTSIGWSEKKKAMFATQVYGG